MNVSRSEDSCRRKAAFNRAFEATKLRRLITSVSIFPVSVVLERLMN
jgi:hypothetical protein